MKTTTKVYRILLGRQKGTKDGKNINYMRGYNDALLDAMKVETEMKQGLSFVDPYDDQRVC